MQKIRRLVPRLASVPLLATITFAQATITVATTTTNPPQVRTGQPMSVSVTFASFCRVGLIDYGDGSKDVALLPEASNSTHGQHTYANAGWYSIKTFAATGSSTAACKGGPLTVQVNGTGKAPPPPPPPPTAPPTTAGAGISLQSVPLQAGHAATIVVRFASSCSGAKISYGDGSPDQPLAQGGAGSSQSKSHVYSAAGTYSVTTYFAQAAAAKTLAPGLVTTYTANCKGGPVSYTVVPPATNNGAGAPNTNTAGAPTQCNDGTVSNATGKGACAHHGGVKASGTAAVNTPPAPSAPPNSGQNGSANASPNTSSSGTPCNDGTVSNATGKGACAHHGGIKSTGTAVTTPPAPPPVPNAAPNTNTNANTVACKDGTMVTKGKGACKGHGGYADSSSASPNSP